MNIKLILSIILILSGCSVNPMEESLCSKNSCIISPKETIKQSINLSIDESFSEEDTFSIRDAFAEWNYALDYPIIIESNQDGHIFNWETHPSGIESIAGQMTEDKKSIVLFSIAINENVSIKSVAMHEIGHIILSKGNNPTHLDNGLMSSDSDGFYKWNCIDSYTISEICKTTDVCGEMPRGTCSE